MEDKLTKLQSALDLLKGQDLDALKQALVLVGEGIESPQNPTSNAPRFDTGSKIKIAILQRGWVYVGEFSQDGSKFTLSNASSIRYWGTTKGLGELVSGPTDKTKLDKAGTVTFERLTTVALLDVDDSAWKL